MLLFAVFLHSKVAINWFPFRLFFADDCISTSRIIYENIDVGRKKCFNFPNEMNTDGMLPLFSMTILHDTTVFLGVFFFNNQI